MAAIVAVAIACGSSSSSTPAPTIPVVYNKIYGITSITLDGEFLVIATMGVPEHKTPYYSEASGKHIAYDGTNANFAPNPQVIADQNLSYRIPLNPQTAVTHAATQAGPIGIAVNGVAFYNQFADETQSLPLLPTDFNSIDQYNGHTQVTGQYHYHQEPLFLTANLGIGSEHLLGFILDGFPLYGPKENGTTVTKAMLDTYHGHFAVTQDYPSGIYHYHITSDSPYIVGTGYNGTPGTVKQ